MRVFGLMEDVGVIADFLRIVLTPEFKGLTPEMASVFLNKIIILIEHQNVTYIKYGVIFATYLVDRLRDDIIQALNFAPMGGAVDLARENRMEKYGQVL